MEEAGRSLVEGLDRLANAVESDRSLLLRKD
jgi:hypothetical protein